MYGATKQMRAAERAIDRLVNEAREDGSADRYAGKRGETRFADGVLLEITTDPAQPAGWKAVYMHNVSRGGCAFWSRQQLQLRTAVWVREVVDGEPLTWISGEVSHCTVGIRGFLIGVAFEKPSVA